MRFCCFSNKEQFNLRGESTGSTSDMKVDGQKSPFPSEKSKKFFCWIQRLLGSDRHRRQCAPNTTIHTPHSSNTIAHHRSEPITIHIQTLPHNPVRTVVYDAPQACNLQQSVMPGRGVRTRTRIHCGWQASS